LFYPLFGFANLGKKSFYAILFFYFFEKRKGDSFFPLYSTVN